MFGILIYAFFKNVIDKTHPPPKKKAKLISQDP